MRSSTDVTKKIEATLAAERAALVAVGCKLVEDAAERMYECEVTRIQIFPQKDINLGVVLYLPEVLDLCEKNGYGLHDRAPFYFLYVKS